MLSVLLVELRVWIRKTSCNHTGGGKRGSDRKKDLKIWPYLKDLRATRVIPLREKGIILTQEDLC